MTAPAWQPVQARERVETLDLLRGFALFGVLLVNFLYFFRVPLFEFILRRHVDPGPVNAAIDNVVMRAVEHKAFDLFSLSFGIGMAVQAERAASRGVSVSLFLVRRFAVLLAFGLCHLLLVSNVDILCLYAVCGLIAIPFLRLPGALLAVAGLAAIFGPAVLRGIALPPEPAIWAHIAEAHRVFGHGSYPEIVRFQFDETRRLIVPLLTQSAQNTFGFMLLGAGLWRLDWVRNAGRYRRRMWFLALVGTVSGLLLGLHAVLAIGYAAFLLAWPESWRRVFRPVAAAGRMALSNYVTQSFLSVWLFYGYGFGLFGRMTAMAGLGVVAAIYAMQLAWSVWWLRRYRFGPLEWGWRSLTYGRAQPMRRGELVEQAGIAESA